MTPFELVTEFFEKHGYHIALLNKPKPLEPEVILLRQRLMLEELGEIAIACHEHDLEKIADGLCDLIYVVVGTCISFGVPVPNNLISGVMPAKLPPDVVITHYLGLVSEAVTQCVITVGNNAGQLSMTELMPSQISQLREIYGRALWRINDFASICSINLEECFREVHRSNMTKQAKGTVPTGQKYAQDSNCKGEGYVPPNLKPLLGIRG